LKFYFIRLLPANSLQKNFVKKTSKTPAKEIEKAKRYRKDYIQRKGEMQ
jgi:phage-related protein